jgi:hypothetical protein
MGHLESIFICKPEIVERLYGKTIFFGEVLGKHSDIFCIVDPNDIQLLDVKDSTVEDLVAVFVKDVSLPYYTISGHNPLEYIDKDE